MSTQYWIITSFYSYYSSNTYYIHHARDFQQYYVCMYVLSSSIILAENSNTIPILHLLAKFSSCTLLKFVTYWSVRKFQLCAAAVQRNYRPFFPHSLGISNQRYSTTMATVLEPEERIESVTVDGLVSSVYLDRMLRI